MDEIVSLHGSVPDEEGCSSLGHVPDSTASYESWDDGHESREDFGLVVRTAAQGGLIDRDDQFHWFSPFVSIRRGCAEVD